VNQELLRQVLGFDFRNAARLNEPRYRCPIATTQFLQRASIIRVAAQSCFREQCPVCRWKAHFARTIGDSCYVPVKQKTIEKQALSASSASAILPFDRRGGEVGFHADHVRAEFVHEGLGVVKQRRVVVERDDAHLVEREREQEVAHVMLDEGSDEPLVRAERRAMDVQTLLCKSFTNDLQFFDGSLDCIQ
jgi:hypothetical protein